MGWTVTRGRGQVQIVRFVRSQTGKRFKPFYCTKYSSFCHDGFKNCCFLVFSRRDVYATCNPFHALCSYAKLFQVMFSDGIRPGGDLTELDGSPERRPVSRRPRPGMSRRPKRLPAPAGSTDIARSLLPPGGALPYISGKGPGDPNEVCEALGRGEAVAFSVNRNLRVYVKLILCKCVKYCTVGLNVQSTNNRERAKQDTKFCCALTGDN